LKVPAISITVTDSAIDAIYMFLYGGNLVTDRYLVIMRKSNRTKPDVSL